MTVYNLRRAGLPYLQDSSNTFSKLGLSLHLHTLARSLQPCRKPRAVRNGQFPKPSSVGCQIFPPHMSPAEAAMLPVAPESQPFSFLQCTVHRYRSLLTVHSPRPDVSIAL